MGRFRRTFRPTLLIAGAAVAVAVATLPALATDKPAGRSGRTLAAPGVAATASQPPVTGPFADLVAQGSLVTPNPSLTPGELVTGSRTITVSFANLGPAAIPADTGYEVRLTVGRGADVTFSNFSQGETRSCRGAVCVVDVHERIAFGGGAQLRFEIQGTWTAGKTEVTAHIVSATTDLVPTNNSLRVKI